MKVFVLSVFIMLTGLLSGQTMWEEPLLLREPGVLDWNESSATNGNSEIVHVWSEAHSGEISVFAMKFDNEGNSLWGEEAILVDASTDAQINPSIISTNDGCYLLVWEDDFAHPRHLRAQKLDNNGEKMWAANGITFAENYDYEVGSLLSLFPNDLGGAIVVWTDSGNSRCAVNLNSDGINQWGESESGLSFDYIDYRQFVSDGAGGLIVLEKSAGPITTEFSLTRIASNGEDLWTQDFVIDGINGYMTNVEVIYNNIDSYYLLTEEFVNSVAVVRVRKISLTGEIAAMEANIPFNNQSMADKHFLAQTTNDNGNLFLVTFSYDAQNVENNIFLAYNLNQQFNHVWNESGVSLDNYNFETYYHDTRAECSNSGELFISNRYSEIVNQYWAEYYTKLYKVDAQGNLQTGNGDLIQAETSDTYRSSYFKYDGDLFFAWKERRDGYFTLKHQVLNNSMQTTLAESTSVIRHIETGEVLMGHGIATYPLADSESSVVIWRDTKLGVPDRIMYQIVHADGTLEFPGNGLFIADSSMSYISSFHTAQNELGQICLVWSHQGWAYIKSRIIDSDGSLLGSEEDEAIYSNPMNYIQNISLNTKNNQFYLSFMETSSRSEKSVFVLSSENNSDWSEPILIDSFSGYGAINFLSTKMINNYCLIETVPNTFNIYKLSENEEVSLIQAELYAYYPKFYCDSANNLFLYWQNPQAQIFVQGVRDNNELFWNNPLVVSYHSQNHETIYAANPDIIVTDGIYFIWNQSTDYVGNEVRAQKISFTGEKIWNEEGLLLSSMSNDDNQSRLKHLNEDYIAVFWAEGESCSEKTYKVDLMSNDGSLLLGENSLALTEHDVEQYDIQTVNLADNKIMLIWEQNYQGPNTLYAQMIDFSAVDNETNDVSPMTMTLRQNYPNPFNPETNISFNITKLGKVKLEVYNLKGQKVKTLVNSNFEVGKHTVVWNGKDDGGKQVASGIYFYRLKNGTNSSTRKMILMK